MEATLVNIVDANTAGRSVTVNADGSINTTASGTGTGNVNLTQVAGATVAQGHGTAAPALRVELPTDGTGVVGLNTGSNAVGTVGVTPGAAALTSVKIDTNSSGDLSLVVATTAKSTKFYRLLLVAAASTTITVKDGATTLTGAITLGTGGSIILDYSGEPWWTGSVNTAFIINNSAAVQISGTAYYVLS